MNPTNQISKPKFFELYASGVLTDLLTVMVNGEQRVYARLSDDVKSNGEGYQVVYAVVP